MNGALRDWLRAERDRKTRERLALQRAVSRNARSADEIAEQIIQGLLADGPRLVGDVERAAKAVGISPWRLRTTRARLRFERVDYDRELRAWHWRLPEGDE